MDRHGSQGKEIGFAQNISFLKRIPIYLVVQTGYPEITAKKCISGISNFNTYADSSARYERV